MSTLDQRYRVITSNSQKKLNMIERGKMYSDIVKLEGKTQTEIADRLQVSVAQVSNCIQAYNMPNELKELVAQGILSDSEAFNKYRNEIKTSDIEETNANATAFAQEIKTYSENRVAKGEAKRVTTKVIESKGEERQEAPKTRFSREVKADVANAMTEINYALEGVEEGQGATIELNAEQVAILRKAGVHF
jgi:transposase